MSVLLVEPEAHTRALLEELLRMSLLSIPFVATDEIKNAPVQRYDAVILRLDSIQEVEGEISRYAGPDSLLIQTSFRLAEPGAGIRIKSLQSLKKKEHLLCEIDQNLPDWPIYLVRSLLGHFKILPRIDELVVKGANFDSRGWGAADQMRFVLRLAEENKLIAIKTAKQYLSMLPPLHAAVLMSHAVPVPGLSQHFKVFSALENPGRRPLPHVLRENLAKRYSNPEEIAREYIRELDACFESMLVMRRIPKNLEFGAWLLRDKDVPLNLQSPFFFCLPASFGRAFQGQSSCLILPVPCGDLGMLRSELFLKIKELRPVMRRELTHLLNDAEQPSFRSEWYWLDMALARWFEGRYLEEDSLKKDGLAAEIATLLRGMRKGSDEIFYRNLPWQSDLPLDDPLNLGMAVRFLQFMELRCGVQGVLDLRRSKSTNPLKACHDLKFIDVFFEWLLDNYLDELIVESKPTHVFHLQESLDHCSFHLWQIPVASRSISFEPEAPRRQTSLRATLVHLSDRRREELQPGIQFPLEPGERILMIRNIGYRGRAHENQHDDGMQYQLEMGGRGR